MNALLHEFQEATNTKFKVSIGEHCLELELIEVTDKGSTSDYNKFSLIFQGPQEVLLHQSIYSLRHERMGVLELFMVPVGQNAEGYVYQIIFN